MAASLQVVGPHDDMRLPHQSLGFIFYNELRKKNPSQIILVDDTTNEVINYGQLLKIATKLARALTKLGVKQRNVITIVAENNWRYLASIIACYFIGAVVNLLNQEYTSGELKYFLKLTQPVLIFCTAKTVENVLRLRDKSFFTAKNVIVYDAKSTNQVENFDNLLVKIDDSENFCLTEVDSNENVALILTSSGTTGLPKCVMLTHTNLRITILGAGDSNCLGLNENERTVAYLPFSHIFGCGASLSGIFYGTKNIIMDRFNPDRFLKIIENHKISKLFTVPPILHFLVKSPLVDQYDISSVQDIICGGAPVSKNLSEMAEKRLNTKSLRQVYGMTETAGATTTLPIGVSKHGTVGKVTITNIIKVCDVETGKSLPPNQIGEIRIFGPGVMKGYLGNNTETKNAFDEEGFWKSGDLVCYDKDGFLYIVDRLKDIIKYKGFQVSPAELENLLLQHASVKDAGVTGIPDERAGEVPLAFVVKQPGASVTEAELMQFIEQNVSVHKRLYGGVHFVDEIPKSASGKILRRKLKTLL